MIASDDCKQLIENQEIVDEFAAKSKTPQGMEKQEKIKHLKALISQYEKYLNKSLSEGIGNLAEIFKTQIKMLNKELETLQRK